MMYGRTDDRIIELQSTIEEREAEIKELEKELNELKEIIWKMAVGETLTEMEQEKIQKIETEIQMEKMGW
jgi:predicted RNase H-like nuclease (RuvC/YqgF family)